MPESEADDALNESLLTLSASDRRSWLIATGVVVALILAFGVFLATRPSDSRMPGMDMGSEAPVVGDELAVNAVRVPIGALEEHEPPARRDVALR